MHACNEMKKCMMHVVETCVMYGFHEWAFPKIIKRKREFKQEIEATGCLAPCQRVTETRSKVSTFTAGKLSPDPHPQAFWSTVAFQIVYTGIEKGCARRPENT